MSAKAPVTNSPIFPAKPKACALLVVAILTIDSGETPSRAVTLNAHFGKEIQLGLLPADAVTVTRLSVPRQRLTPASASSSRGNGACWK